MFARTICILIVITFNLLANWGQNGRRLLISDTLETESNLPDSTTEEASTMLIKIKADSFFIDDDLYFVGDINDPENKIDYYKLGKYVSRKASCSYQNGYIPLFLGAGIVLPIGGPIITNGVCNKLRSEITNDFGLSQNYFKMYNEGYLSIYNRKQRIKTIGLGTLGSLIGLCIHFYLYIIIDQSFIHPDKYQ
jgi:hypothetical protein